MMNMMLPLANDFIKTSFFTYTYNLHISYM